jgi:hypothetical protein
LQEQSEGINQIFKAVSTMDIVTQQNATNAEELAASKVRRYCPVVLRSEHPSVEISQVFSIKQFELQILPPLLGWSDNG